MTGIFDLTGKVALVTGGSRGLGKAMARGLAQAGADIVISSRHEQELQEALPEILKDTGRKGAYVVADMGLREQVKGLAQAALEHMGRVDILVNNAGTSRPQPADEQNDDDWDYVMEINLNSVMSLTRQLIPQMKARKWGRIIHIASVMAFVSNPARGGYSATKAALLGMARGCAFDLGESGITVNCICPGFFLTDLPNRLLTDEQKQRAAHMSALNRWGDPSELVGPVVLLASEAGSFITGSAMVIDGGYLAR